MSTILIKQQKKWRKNFKHKKTNSYKSDQLPFADDRQLGAVVVFAVRADLIERLQLAEIVEPLFDRPGALDCFLDCLYRQLGLLQRSIILPIQARHRILDLQSTLEILTISIDRVKSNSPCPNWPVSPACYVRAPR